jgi:hypothetical protein
MATLFDRRLKVVVGTTLVTLGLRCSFRIVKALDADPNGCDLHVYNLKEKTRNDLSSAKEPLVWVEAGYADVVSQLFMGNARAVDSVRHGPDWDTHVQCGETETDYCNATVNQSFGPGTALNTVFGAVTGAMNVDATQAVARLAAGDIGGGITQFMQGTVVSGNAYGQVDKLVKAADPELRWALTDGKLLLYKGDEVIPANRFELLSARTGMLTTPETATRRDPKSGVHVTKCRILLRPGLMPGNGVRVESQGKSPKDYRLLRITHHGDTHGTEWYSDLELEPL